MLLECQPVRHCCILLKAAPDFIDCELVQRVNLLNSSAMRFNCPSGEMHELHATNLSLFNSILTLKNQTASNGFPFRIHYVKPIF